MKKAFKVLFFFMILIESLYLNHQVFKKRASFFKEEKTDEINQHLDPVGYRILSFGYLPVIIDWMIIQVLLDQKNQPMRASLHPGIYYRLELLSVLDPAFFEVYDAGAHLLSIIYHDYLGAQLLLEKANDFLNRHLIFYSEDFQKKFWSQSWRLRLLLGYLQLFHLNNIPKATIAFQQASQMPHAPLFLNALSNRLKKPEGQYEVGLRVLEIFMKSIKDENMKKEIQEKQKNLKLSQFLFFWNIKFNKYIKKNRIKIKNFNNQKKIWDSFVKHFCHHLCRDPYGGVLSLDSIGRVVSTTVYEPVFGLKSF